MSPRLGALVFSVNSFAAAMLALFIGFSVGLPRPYWAMMTVYIVAQRPTGALRSKAAYRVVGTVIGGIAAVVLIPPLVNAPTLLCLAIAAWTGLCLYVSLLDRTPRAYIFMLAGYTTAIIGFPSVGAPQLIFETALARVEEIVLGIGCATLIHTIVLPQDVGRVLGARVAAFLRDGQTWIGDALTGRRDGRERQERRRLASGVTELHLIASHLPFDTANLPARTRAVRSLEARLAYMPPLISAIEDRLAQLGPPPEPLARLLADVASWAEADAAPQDQRSQAQALRDGCAALAPTLGDGVVAWPDLLTGSLLIRLDELIAALQDGRDLARVIGGSADAAGERVAALLKAPARRRLHLDHGMAALSGLSLAAAVMACCAAWIGLGWPEGAIAALSAAVFCSFFATQDDPAPAIGRFLAWLLVSLPVAALYLFAILPAIDGFPMLVLVLSPALLVIGYMQARPRWAAPGIAIFVGFAGPLALQARFSADLPEFINGNLAQIVGVASALGFTRLMRSVGAGWAARRILKRGWREVGALARRRQDGAADAWISAMLDRVGLINSRAALAEPEDRLDAHDALADMRVGLNLIDLRTAAGAAADDEALNRTLAAVAATYEARLSDRDARPGPALLSTIDQAIDALAAQPPRPASQRGFAALTGLRRNLCPDAPAYIPGLARAA